MRADIDLLAEGQKRTTRCLALVLSLPLRPGAAHVVTLRPVGIEQGTPGSAKFDQFRGHTWPLYISSLRVLYGNSHDESHCIVVHVVPAVRVNQILGRVAGDGAARAEAATLLKHACFNFSH